MPSRIDRPGHLIPPDRSKWPPGLVVTVAVICLGVIGACDVTATPTIRDEQLIRHLWQQHDSAPTAHAEIAGLCARIESQHSGTPFLPLVRCLAAWHLMQQGQLENARIIWAGLASATPGGDPIGQAAQRMARTWLTRMDRDLIRDALQKAYRDQVQYPKTLAELGPSFEGHPLPTHDRWGDPWVYEWTSFRFLRVSPGQRYRLESRNIRNTSDVREAMKIAYGNGFDIRPVRLIDAGGGRRTIVFETAGGSSVVLTSGATHGGQTLVYAGNEIIVLTNADHWIVFPRPAP